MKKKLIISAILFCVVLIAVGQTNNRDLSQNSSRNAIPEHIRERKAFKRAEWYFNQRAFPYDTIPMLKYRHEMTKEIQKAKNNSLKNTVTWSSVGPAGVQCGVTQWGVVSGRVRAIAVHPTDPLIVYIGAASGGLWKTTDGGQTWGDIGHDLESLTFGALAIDPGNPDVIYAGSGECILLEDFTIYPGSGLYKSSDGGATWILITDGFDSLTFFSDLAVSPYNSNVVLASLGGGNVFTGVAMPNEGVWRSLDGGITWDKMLDIPEVADIAFHPTNPNIVYAAAGGYISPLMGFYISNDQGANWAQSNSGLMLPPLGGRMQFDISQSNPNIIYSVIYEFAGNPTDGPTRAFKSVDGGNNWAQISAGTQLGGNYGGGWLDQGWYDLCITVDPDDPNHVLIGNVELHRTVNGSTFSPVRPYGNNAYGSLCHVDYHKLVFAPSNHNYLFIGCDGGVYKSTDKGYTATSQNQGLATMQFYRIASHPSNPQVLIGGMQDNSTAMTTNGGQSWEEITSGDGMDCLFHPNPDTIYTSSQYGYFYRSINGGTTFNYMYNANGAWVTPILMHPTNQSILYTANKRIWKSTNGGNSFQNISGPSNLVTQFITTMAQSQVNPNFMIFGTGMDHPHYDTVFVVKISTDEGSTWTDVSENIPGESRWVARVTTDPVDANTMYVLRTGFSVGNKVWKTTDLGWTWTNISGNLPDLPCSDLFIDPENTQHLYLANDIGIYHSANGGISWEYASEGIPYVPAIDFDYVKIGTDRYLRVGTYGRSIYETILPNYCLANGITFTTQEEIDNFQTNYPGCTEIEGDVTINGNDITNLNGLSVLTSIGGGLTIGGFLAGYNPALISISGLEGLTSIASNLIVAGNSALTNLAGLSALTSIGGGLSIGTNWMTGLNGNPALVSLTGLEGLTSLSNLEIYGNSVLTDLTGLDNLTFIENDLVIKGNGLINLMGLGEVSSIGGNVYFEYNNLTNMLGLGGVTSIGSDLRIEANNSLISLSGLENLSYVGATLMISLNPSLTSISSLSALTHIGYNIYIEMNENLTSISTLEGVTSPVNLLQIEGNDVLTSLTGLEGLTSINMLEINGNDALTSLMGLINVTSVVEEIWICYNPNLPSLAGIDSIESGSLEHLYIFNNNSLSTCHVQSICNYLIAPGGTIEIHDNTPGCNSPEEVLEACAITTVEEIETGNEITIISNPANDKITISSPIINGNTKLSIFNINGSKVIEMQLNGNETQINISALPRGVYFVRLQNEKMVEVGKIVKQ